MAVNIFLKRSATASKRPVGASMAFGELNLNYDAATGGLFYKNASGGVVKVGPCQVSSTAPNSSPAGSSGNSAGEFWYDTSTQTLKLYDGSAWVEAGGAVQGVTGTAPITVDNTDPLNPVVGISAASTTAPGAVQLNDTTSSSSTTEALTANQGRILQTQIDALVVSSNLTFAGTIDASTGDMVTVSTEGAAAGFVIGDPLPSPDAGNTEYFVIVTVPGEMTPPGGTAQECHQGDWWLSDGTIWNFLDVGYNAPYATTSVPGVVQLATDAEVQAGVETTHAVTSSGLQSKVSDSVVSSSSTSIASSLAVKDAYDAGLQGQTDAAAAQATANAALPKAGGMMTGALELDAGVPISFDSGNSLFDISDSVTSAVSSVAASSAAAKTAYDAAISANDLANSAFDAAGLAQTDADQALVDAAAAQATADAALPLAGGEMTGALSFQPGAGFGVVFGDGSELIAISDAINSFDAHTAASSYAVNLVNLTAEAAQADATQALSDAAAAQATADAAVPDAAYTAAGDLLVGTGAGTYTALPAGAADYILQSNGDGTLSWVENSAGDVTSVSGTAPITVDNSDPQNPVIGVSAASTSAAGVVQLNDTTTSTSITQAATANAVKVAYDAAIAAQNGDPAASATVLFVNGTNGNNSTAARGTARAFATVTAALAAAQEGDTIFVAPATYTESVTLSKGVNLVGTWNEQAISCGPKIVGTFTVNISGAGTRNWAVSNFQFMAASAGTNCAVVTNNSFASGGISTFSNCFFQQFTDASLTEQAFATSGTWTRSLYMRNCTFDGNFTHNAGTTAGASGYLVIDELLGIAGNDKYYKVMSGTCEFRNPSNALAPVLHTGGVAIFSNILAWISNAAATTSIFGGTGFAYKGTSAGLGQAVVYFAGQGVNVVEGSTWGKLSVGSNVVYAFGNVLYDTSLATLSGIPLTAAAPNPNGVLANMSRPQWNYLTTSSSVTAANQLGVVLDSTNGNVYTVTAYDAGTY